MRIVVNGGTNAGNRPPFNGRAKRWTCKCFVDVSRGIIGVDFGTEEPSIVTAGPYLVEIRKVNIGALVACPDCRMRRPN